MDSAQQAQAAAPSSVPGAAASASEMTLAEVKEKLDSANRSFAMAPSLYERFGHDSADRARDKGWALLREVLEAHPWKPRRVPKRRPKP